MKESVFVRVTVEVIDEARIALHDFLAGLSGSGIIEETDWEGAHGPACIYLPRDGAERKLAILRNYLDSLAELWGKGAVISFEAVEVADPGWATEYQRYFTAQRVTPRIVVAPPWESYTRQGDEIVITIVPGPAFGTGTHETTRLCLSAMEEISGRQRVESLLDVGCGSAILSIAGALLGIARVIGVESDPEAVLSARENVARNDLADRVTIREETFENPGGAFDMVVANLTAREIEPVIGALFQSVAPGGCLILSGILADEEGKMRRIIEDRHPLHLTGLSTERMGEWIRLVAAGNRG